MTRTSGPEVFLIGFTTLSKLTTPICKHYNMLVKCLAASEGIEPSSTWFKAKPLYLVCVTCNASCAISHLPASHSPTPSVGGLAR